MKYGAYLFTDVVFSVILIFCGILVFSHTTNFLNCLGGVGCLLLASPSLSHLVFMVYLVIKCRQKHLKLSDLDEGIFIFPLDYDRHDLFKN